MKYLIAILGLGISLLLGNIDYMHDFNKALQKAKDKDKKVLMLYSAKYCPECNYMKEVVFNQKEVSAYIKKHFIILSLDIQKDELPKAFNFIGIPTFFIIGKNAKEEHKIIGGNKADKFLQQLKACE